MTGVPSTHAIVKRLSRTRRVCQAMAKERYMNEPHPIRTEAAWRECLLACELAGARLKQLQKERDDLDRESQTLFEQNEEMQQRILRLEREVEDLQPEEEANG